MKMEPIETSAIINQMPGNYPKENLLYSVHGESLKSRINLISYIPHQTCWYIPKFKVTCIYVVIERRYIVMFLPAGLLYTLALNFQVLLEADYTVHEVYQIRCSPTEPWILSHIFYIRWHHKLHTLHLKSYVTHTG